MRLTAPSSPQSLHRTRESLTQSDANNGTGPERRVAHRQQRVRQRYDDMHGGHIEQLTLARREPPLPREERACSEASREAESKVVVAEGRIELAAQRDTTDCVRVAPGSAARGASHALVGARGIPLR